MADCLNYIQLPLATFLQLHPEYLQLFPLRIFHDPRYVVRLHPASGSMEVGFPDDSWQIQ
jgi:hypothetical protein